MLQSEINFCMINVAALIKYFGTFRERKRVQTFKINQISKPDQAKVLRQSQ